MSLLKDLDKFLAGQSTLNPARRHALDEFRKHALRALELLIKQARSPLDRQLYEHMAYNVKTNPLMFYPRKVLRYDPVHGSVTQGEHVRSVDVVQRGNEKFLVQKDYINLPADLVFAGDQLTLSGVFTMTHEYGHFPKPLLLQFAYRNGINIEQAEELLADILSAKLARALGFSLPRILSHFEGRDVVYGGFPFRSYILHALRA